MFLLKTVRVAAITAILCAVLGYPAAYFIAMSTYTHKWLLLLLLIVPFWISFTIRTFSWIHILGEQGLINVVLLRASVIDEPMPMLYTEGAVIMGLLHFLLPYMILNVYVSLESIDRTLISAARSMGCTSAQAFREVTLPLSLPGLGAGLLLCFVLAAGSYVTPQLLGGSRDALFGNLIYDTIMSQLNWPMGATLSIVLFVLLGCFAAMLPWNVIGFWNALVGFALLYGSRDPVGHVLPAARSPATGAITERVAVVMPVHNEDPDRIVRHLAETVASLDATGEGAAIEIFLLSDTQDDAIAAAEAVAFARWRDGVRRPERLHYRRRPDNQGQKTGNI
jgi:spermidine/putrescine transport system permease protein